VPREETSNGTGHIAIRKLFIGGLSDELNKEELMNYFEKYGRIIDCTLMYDKDGRPRGFAFLEFDGESNQWHRSISCTSRVDFDPVDKVILNRPHTINELRIDVKKAIPREQQHFQAQQRQFLQQHQQQQQNYYAWQMQAAAAYHYYYSGMPYNLLNNGTGALTVSSPTSLLATNGNGNLSSDDMVSNNRTFSNAHQQHLTQSPRHTSASNNRRQSSHGSQ
jgi:hypothetical protein